MLERVIQQIRDSDTLSRTGKIENIIGMSIEASGGRGAMGDICRIYSAESNSQVLAEVVGFKNEHMLLMPYQNMSGLAPEALCAIQGGGFVCGWGTSCADVSLMPWGSR